jgi:hypothetical protein
MSTKHQVLAHCLVGEYYSSSGTIASPRATIR